MAQANLILKELRGCGVTHVIGIPDNSSAVLFDLLSRDAGIRLVTATREGEAFAIAAGVWLGGEVPLILVQNTGFLESGDSFRGVITRMRVPLVCLITYRGYRKMMALGFEPEKEFPDPETLSRAELDSAAVITEPTLRAWGLPFEFLDSDADVTRIAEAFDRAEKNRRAVALLVTEDMT